MYTADEVLALQDGVITRQQALAGGLTLSEIRRGLRRRDWVGVYPGVYVNHTGPLTWRQRAWCAVLSVPGSALSHQSAVAAVVGAKERSPTDPIHLAVHRKASAPQRAGVAVHRYAQLEERVLWNAHPPRVRVEHALIDLAGAAHTEIVAIAHLADAVQARITTAPRLLAALGARPWCKRRKLLEGVLADIHDGTGSVLEHAYLTRVERPHGLPKPRRQAPTRVGRRGYRDVEYDEGLIVELDGRAPHDNALSRDRDMERDLDAAVAQEQPTLRLGWGQVYGRPCVTAEKVAKKLTALGWSGAITRCANCKVPSVRST